MLRLAGFQDGGEGYPAVGQVLAHAEEEAVQMVTQLDGLTEENGEQSSEIRGAADRHDVSQQHVRRGIVPDFEVGENQLTSRESYPVSTPASVGKKKINSASRQFSIICHKQLELCVLSSLT